MSAEHSGEGDAPLFVTARVMRHTYNPWSGKCGCGSGPFSVAEHREHVFPPAPTQGADQ